MPPSPRLEELEARFSALAPRLHDSPEKEALSILHAIIQERTRFITASPAPAEEENFARVANLYKTAPGMSGAAENSGLPVATHAPEFSLPDASGKMVSLAEFRGKNVVLVFYPLDWSPACSDQLSLYQSELDEFEKYNAQVIAISVDSLYSHGAWAAVRGITFPLLADFHPRGEVAALYKVWRQSNGFSERALYVIDTQGIIRYAHISPELPKIPSIYTLFDELRKLNEHVSL